MSVKLTTVLGFQSWPTTSSAGLELVLMLAELVIVIEVEMGASSVPVTLP